MLNCSRMHCLVDRLLQKFSGFYVGSVVQASFYYTNFIHKHVPVTFQYSSVAVLHMIIIIIIIIIIISTTSAQNKAP